MTHRASVTTAVSAPGKVLLTGGYLVLDRDYTGTVFALDARIHVIVQQLNRQLSTSSLDATKEAAGGEEQQTRTDHSAEDHPEESIVVRSPQFVNAVWEYGVRRCDDGGGVKVTQRGDGPRNPFVETSLNYALTYIGYVAGSKDFGSLSITILADNDYYSDTGVSNGPGAQIRGRFRNFGVPLQEAHKTGLGSSAALVTALVSALVVHRTMHPDDLVVTRDKLHNLAQAAHCAAQGKVGSGFDVGAAIYGSCLYRRFSPSILEKVGDVGTPGFEERLFSTVEDLDQTHPWDTECVDFGMRLPPGMQMVLCDVDCGSQTPSMVKKVLAWRDQNREEADALWASLQENNEKLRLELRRLSHGRDSPENEAETAEEAFKNVRTLIQRTREYLRTMTQKTGVPIEPRVQTELLDTVSEVKGVIGGVVPGAGGYDAIALLIEDDIEVVNRLNRLFETYKSKVEDDFGGKIERVRMLGVRHGSEGKKLCLESR
ncbi:Phosphomevalonate kinase [Rasamsonia emersonii CBS 393.64]|uniref:Phosphomevalonate kinase n=1 Tax=Rasamsonia emersonii (strain ATCC 16479 / CBS 393.64 / IMI 116815) TaxID=1408163 RepID=A0A0F4YJ61_RASE3|nr:Phosphomevalonate kinase [Rasamsonia emersonii CBS 393.64]KKA18332.1 Phosphomevalonate kinase [Rasamsonia emersonii CBS 393.64]